MFEFINKYLFGASVPVILMICGIYFSLSLKLFYLRHPIKCIKILFKKNSDSGVSPFRAVTLALAGTLGVGNIVGVASAIGLGGFGAVFWMWVSALCAMVLKYAEIVLALEHRRLGTDNKPYGGAMYYIKDCFDKKKMFGFGTFLAAAFSVLCVLDAVSMGCVVQVNSISNAFCGVLGFDRFFLGSFLAVLTLVIICRGAEKISSLTELLVPVMSLGYILLSLIVIVSERDNLIPAFAGIFKNAFTPGSAFGGIVGFITSRALRFGTMRGLLSNEAGCGTAPTAHATSNTRESAEQGIWGIFEVFVDTILLCTMTALVIILNYSEVASFVEDPVMMTIKAYSAVLGDFAEYFLVCAVLLFGFATVICWFSYGAEAVRYLSGKKIYTIIYTSVYSASVFAGALMAPGSIWQLADFAIGAMTLINLGVLWLSRKEIRSVTLGYFQRKEKPPHGGGYFLNLRQRDE